MRQKYLGGCGEFCKKFSLCADNGIYLPEICCVSCHTDHDDYGYSLRCIDIEQEGYFEVCCAVGIEYDEKLRLRK